MVAEKANERISIEDVKALKADPSADNKVKIIEKISKQYNASDFSDMQIASAEEIFRSMVKDTEIEVRKALSQSIVSSDVVPKDIVMDLARDVEAVACPILEFSEIFSEEDLIALVNETENVANQVAIANRANVSEGVSDVLVNTGQNIVVENLLQNDSAKIGDESAMRVVEEYSKNELVVDSLITRGTMSEKVISKMAEVISEKMRTRIEARYQTSFKEIGSLFKESSQDASLKVLSQQMIEDELLELIENLDINGKLEGTLDDRNSRLNRMILELGVQGKLPAISSLSLGHILLFQIVLSKMTSLPYANITKLISDSNGWPAVYQKSKLPPTMVDVAGTAIRIIGKIEEGNQLDSGEKIRNNPNIFIRELTNAGQEARIRNMANFISIIKNNIEKRKGAW